MGYDNAHFCNLVYRIITTPDRWHHDCLDVMHQVLSEKQSINEPESLDELKIGGEILQQIRKTKEAMTAFGSLLDTGLFKIVILDKDHQVVYHNKSAEPLLEHLKKGAVTQPLNSLFISKLQLAAKQHNDINSRTDRGGLYSVDYLDQNRDQIYTRSIYLDGNLSTAHYLVLVADQSSKENALNADLIQRYGLTAKEQTVLLKLTNGYSIKQISETSFVSENTTKTHLQSLYRKTLTCSQADVIRLALTDEAQMLDTYFGLHEPLISEPENQSEDKFVHLKNGKRIAYREYGPVNGDTIIIFHNAHGSRISIPNNCQEICQRHNKRVIIPDRQGYGLSSFAKPFEWNDMFDEFINTIDLNDYDLLATGLASAAALRYATKADNRLKRLRICSPVVVNQPGDKRYLKGILKPVSELAKKSKCVTKELYKLWLKSVMIDLSKYYGKILNGSIGTAEAKQFTQENTLSVIANGFRDACSQGLDGVAEDLIDCLTPQNVDFNKIKIGVDLWWGSEDDRISLEGVKNLASELRYSKIHIKDGYSQHLYYALFEEVISHN